MFRLLGLLGGLSVATDLGTGAPMEESLRRCVVAVRLARALGEPDEVVDEVLWTSLLQHLGCTAWSHEGAAVWGDEIRTTRLAFLTDLTAAGRVGDVGDRPGRGHGNRPCPIAGLHAAAREAVGRRGAARNL